MQESNTNDICAVPWGNSARALVIWTSLVAGITGIGLMFVPTPLFGKDETQVGADKRSTARTTGDDHKVDQFVQQEPFSIDHSIMNNPNLLLEPNPAPMVVAAYD